MEKGKLLVRGTSAMMGGSLDPMDVVLNDTADSSSGSLIYGSYVIRSLEALGYAVDVDNCGAEKGAFGEEEAAWTNASYDAYVIPLGDVIRPEFAGGLDKLARFVRRLDIPCVVIGIGVGEALASDMQPHDALDESLRSFAEAVLSRSSCIGVRGSQTADYLAALGFSLDDDLMVIGHPALALCGPDTVERAITITDTSRIALQVARDTNADLAQVIWGLGASYQNAVGVIETTDELRRLYLGKPLTQSYEAVESLYQDDRMVYYLSASSWIKAMESFDLVVTNSVDGAVAARLAGTPAVFIAYDKGALETATYHALPSVSYEDALASKSLDELAAHLAGSSSQESVQQQFAAYALFLEKNGLGTLDSATTVRDLPASSEDSAILQSLAQLSKDEAVTRILAYEKSNRERLEAQVASLEELLREHERVVADAMGAVEAARFMRDGVRASIESLSLALQQRK